MTVGVYGIFDKRDDTCLYVGHSKNIEYRWKQHLRGLKSTQHPRKDFVAWFHQNKEFISFKILDECNDTFLEKTNLEIFWFEKLNPKFYGVIPSLDEKWYLSDDIILKINITKSYKFDLNPDQIEKAYEQSSFSIQALADEWRCSTKTVYNRLKRAGVSKISARSKKWEPIPIQCAICSKEFTPISKKSKTCSRTCRGKLAIPANINSIKNMNTDFLAGTREQRAGKVASHNRWHKSRGVVSDDCEICVASVSIT